VITLYTDEDSAHRRLVREWRSYGNAIWTPADVGQLGQADHVQLEFAAAHGWVIFTSNTGDFTRLNSNWLRSGRSHAGIIVLTEQQLPITLQIRALQLLTTEVPDDAWQSRMEYLMNWVARLPD